MKSGFLCEDCNKRFRNVIYFKGKFLCGFCKMKNSIIIPYSSKKFLELKKLGRIKWARKKL
jgi:hypothetical protein